jgi:ribosomal-protein-alanine acetyltransferase
MTAAADLEPCREATAADLDALLVLEQSCFAEDPWTRGMLSEELSRPGGIFLVLGEPGRPVAFAIGWAVLDDLHVLQVATDPAARRGGLARRLVIAMEARARHAETAWLEVRRDNAAAIALYEALDYRCVGARPRYYTDGCDALLLRKKLRT